MSINIIDHSAEKIYYSLEILDHNPNSIYQIDKDGKSLVRMRNEVYLGDDYFGSFDVVHKAAQKAKTEKDTQDVFKRTTIGIRNKRNKFEDIWTFNNQIDINPEGFGVYETTILLEDGVTRYKNELVLCIKIIFKEMDYGEGSVTRTFFYTTEGIKWKLIRRERLSTIDNTFTVEEFDTNYAGLDCDLGHRTNRINISQDCLLD
ncbi:MAG TPA: hypothetical protein VFQ50_01385 [Flavobacterium sp.]|nr:hypothetical protein [Flavobacterium sp.]